MSATCPECGGEGKIEYEAGGGDSKWLVCKECGGSGEIDAPCWLCRGTGIGQHGDPDTSKCSLCHGKGETK